MNLHGNITVVSFVDDCATHYPPYIKPLNPTFEHLTCKIQWMFDNSYIVINSGEPSGHNRLIVYSAPKCFPQAVYES